MTPTFQLYFVFKGRKITIFRYVTGPKRHDGAIRETVAGQVHGVLVVLDLTSESRHILGPQGGFN